MYIIEIKNLFHRFANGMMGLDGINLNIKAGEFILIAGENGSGKTTLLRHFNGLLSPHSGSIRLDGIPVARDLVRARQMVGMVFQDAESQIVGETVFDDVAFGPENLRLNRKEVDARVWNALHAVGLADFKDTRPHLLSGGEKRRLSIAGVLAMQPKIIVFDEPFTSLDYPGIQTVLKQMVRLNRTGHTIIVTTHDLEKVMTHAHRLILMRAGRVVRDGVPVRIVTESEFFGVRTPCAYRTGQERGSWLN
jgi:biotin transport system ATP-binding protein